jgi:hypothetical protein
MLTFHGRSRVKSVCGLMLCMLGLLAPVSAVAQSAIPTAATEPNSAMGLKKQNAGSATLAQLDGCLTTSDGLMPKLTLFHSRRIYRLEAKPMLLTERPLLFANNVNALVHVTGYLGPLADQYDPDHSPVFIVATIDKLAPTCDVKVSLAQLRKQLEKPSDAAAPHPLRLCRSSLRSSWTCQAHCWCLSQQLLKSRPARRSCGRTHRARYTR